MVLVAIKCTLVHCMHMLSAVHMVSAFLEVVYIGEVLRRGTQNPSCIYGQASWRRGTLFITMLAYICDRFWENPYKRGKYHYSISSVLVISLIFVKIFFIMKMDVWNIVLGPGKDIRSGTHYNSRSKPKTLAGRDSTSRSCTERC